MTASELLTGQKGPLSNQEFNYWMAYLRYKQELEEAASKKK